MLPKLFESTVGLIIPSCHLCSYFCRALNFKHSMTLLILFFLLSIVFSFLCSIWEAVLLSITPTYISSKKTSNPSLAEDLLEIKNDIDRPLSAILTLNTIAHTVGAIGVGAQAAKVFSGPGINIFGFTLGTESIIAAAMTLAILILSEIIPKTIGANKWRSLAPFTVTSLKILIFLLTPFVWLSQLITKRFKSEKGKSVLSKADFYALANNVAQTGVLDSQESKTIQNMLSLDKLNAEDIMTPRTVMKMGAAEMSLVDFYEKNKNLRFSRIPIFENKEDNLIGFILKDEMLQAIIEGKKSNTLKSIVRPIHSVDRNLNLNELLKDLVNGNHQLSAVRDQYGSLVGLVSLEDLFETIHGLEIMDEFDKVEDLQKVAKQIWERRAERLGLVNKN